jgi:hypothetical protein
MVYDGHLFVKTYTSASNCVCGRIVPGLASTIPRSIFSRVTPRNDTNIVSRKPSSNVLEHFSSNRCVLCITNTNDFNVFTNFHNTFNTTCRNGTTTSNENTSSIAIKNVFQCHVQVLGYMHQQHPLKHKSYQPTCHHHA